MREKDQIKNNTKNTNFMFDQANERKNRERLERERELEEERR